jgi:hypothetical protein
MVGSSILGSLFGCVAGAIAYKLNGTAAAFPIFFLPITIAFTAAIEWGWGRARKRDVERREARYKEGKPLFDE